MQSASPDFAQVKSNLKASWMAGDFGQIANYAVKAGEDFVARTEIKPGARVLDVACGTGNTAIPAARAGGLVTGVDIAPNLLEQARKRAVAEQLEIRFDEGDAEELPYKDQEFDIVLTMFGAMFAPRPESVAAELIRVCRPGGLIAMANWTPEGFVGKSFQVTAEMVPPPTGLPAPERTGGSPAVCPRDFEAQLNSAQSSVRLSFQPKRSGGILPTILWPCTGGILKTGQTRSNGLGFPVGSIMGRAQYRDRWRNENRSRVSGCQSD